LTVAGKVASSTDPATWCSYATARRSTVGVGLGFVLNGDGIVCIDLDHCLKEGRLVEWAAPIVEECGGTYVEVSPSGAGLHIFGYGQVGVGRRVRDHRAVEVYGDKRFIAVTGKRWGSSGSSLTGIGGAIEKLV
jgi:primase-polymerase (primpol)-like protein